MALDVFQPPMRPSPGTGHAPEVNLRKASFGDGYVQASPAGLNHIRCVISFRWDYLTLNEARTIEGFLIAQGGYVPFYYTLNGEATPRKWTCAEWSLTEGYPCRFTATFKEDFTTAS
ncbi:phage tail protein [Paracoccus sp. YIM 132242]|uniref:Phage tail protein n=1 Tax=Paracoccus lichenicola TaxID=2665644 RepID=A0A6L6HNA9_9RHOB|nr:phage tail protein [Paracoccus lichenicola]MTD98797.1 phage tail protein [Paracoccus lichenicola]